jgi:hypothetical protein
LSVKGLQLPRPQHKANFAAPKESPRANRLARAMADAEPLKSGRRLIRTEFEQPMTVRSTGVWKAAWTEGHAE